MRLPFKSCLGILGATSTFAFGSTPMPPVNPADLLNNAAKPVVVHVATAEAGNDSHETPAPKDNQGVPNPTPDSATASQIQDTVLNSLLSNVYILDSGIPIFSTSFKYCPSGQPPCAVLASPGKEFQAKEILRVGVSQEVDEYGEHYMLVEALMSPAGYSVNISNGSHDVVLTEDTRFHFVVQKDKAPRLLAVSHGYQVDHDKVFAYLQSLNYLPSLPTDALGVSLVQPEPNGSVKICRPDLTIYGVDDKNQNPFQGYSDCTLLKPEGGGMPSLTDKTKTVQVTFTPKL